MPRFLHLTLALVLLLPPAARALTTGPLLRYDFQALNGGTVQFENLPEQIDPALSAGGWQLRDGSLDSAAGPGGATDLAMLGRSWGGGGSPGNRFTLEITVAPGQALQLDGYSFTERASGSGPTGWSLEIDGATVAGGATASGFTTRSGPLSTGPLQGTLLLALLADGATSDSGSWRIDDFSLSGSLIAVPLPFPLLFLASALPLLGWRCRPGA